MRISRRLFARKNSGWVLILALLISVSIVSGLPYAVASRDAQRVKYDEHLTNLTLPAGTTVSDLKQGNVYEIVDGDTIQLVIDGRVSAVRLFGVDTPERGDSCFREATDRTIQLSGSKVLLLSDAREFDSFRRLLRYVFMPDGTSIDATLVAEGYARAWRDDGRYRDQIVALEEQARAEGRGCLWSGRS